MTNDLLIPIILSASQASASIAEAWLEVVVIALKDASLSEYKALNRIEHFRSGVYSFTVAFPYILASVYLGYYWYIPAILINRRLFFDPALKLLRSPRRRLSLYEGDGPIDNFFAGIFGRNGAKWEILLEALATVAFIVIQGAS